MCQWVVVGKIQHFVDVFELPSVMQRRGPLSLASMLPSFPRRRLLRIQKVLDAPFKLKFGPLLTMTKYHCSKSVLQSLISKRETSRSICRILKDGVSVLPESDSTRNLLWYSNLIEKS